MLTMFLRAFFERICEHGMNVINELTLRGEADII